MGLRENILARAGSLPQVTINVPEFSDQPVTLIAMTGAQRDEFEGRFSGGGKTMKGMRGYVCARFIVDPETLERVFTDEDAQSLQELASSGLDSVLAAFIKLNKLSKEDVDALEGN